MILTRTRGLALGGAILVTAGTAVVAVPLVAADNDGKGGGVEVEVASADISPGGGAPTTTAAPDTTVPTATAPAPAAPAAPTTKPPASSRSAAPTTAPPAAADPAPAPAPAPAAPAPPKLASGRRVNPTGAQVQAAVATLRQRVPLFQPTESQLRTFADAVCTSLDQGQSRAQVESTVRDAVSRIQGASLSAADANFAVGLMIELRCPGYLP